MLIANMEWIPGNWGEFVNNAGTDVKEVIRVQLEILHNHMTAKGNYTEQSTPATDITYNATSEFRLKVNEARKKVDPEVGQASELVQNATDLKNALNTGGEIKQVVNEWGNIKNIGTQTRDHNDNKPAKDAIAEMRGYTITTGEAYTTIGRSHKTANKDSHPVSPGVPPLFRDR